MRIPLAASEYIRRVGAQPDVLMRNRFVEENPVLQPPESLMFMQRPSLKRWVTGLSEGPIRSIYHQAGAFDDDLFAASYETLYRIDADGVATAIVTDLADGVGGGPISFACTGPIGDIPPRLYFADGQTLRFYTTDLPASGLLTGTPANGDTVTIDTTVYQFTNASVDAGTPDGTLANPWLVALGGSGIISRDNLFAAINDSGTPGTDYSTACSEHTTVTATDNTSSGLAVRARDSGIAGNGIVTTETGAALAWGAATLEDGGTSGVTQVATPEDVGIISLGFISGYVIAVPAQGGLLNGRFYWIDPGETVIDPINFATAERSADPVYQVVIYSDQFWLPGQNSSETWTPTGDASAPMVRTQGILFDRGTYPGSALQVKDSMVIVDYDGGVFQIKGGDRRISTPDIEERIRKALAAQAEWEAAHPFL